MTTINSSGHPFHGARLPTCEKRTPCSAASFGLVAKTSLVCGKLGLHADIVCWAQTLIRADSLVEVVLQLSVLCLKLQIARHPFLKMPTVTGRLCDICRLDDSMHLGLVSCHLPLVNGWLAIVHFATVLSYEPNRDALLWIHTYHTSLERFISQV